MKNKQLKKLLLNTVTNLNLLLKLADKRKICVTFDNIMGEEGTARDGVYECSELQLTDFRKYTKKELKDIT